MQLPIQSKADVAEFVDRFAAETGSAVRAGIMSADQQFEQCMKFIAALHLQASAPSVPSVLSVAQ